MKQTRYITDIKNNKDLIDRWADRYSIEEFRLIMWAMIEKYNTRLGKKDDVLLELKKMQDYLNRWILVEEVKYDLNH